MKFGKIIKVVSDCVFVAGLIVAGLFLLLYFTGRKPVQIFIVSSGSMEPAVHTGSVVLVSPQSSYHLGEVVTFYSGSSKKNTSTHRVVGIDDKFIRTAGDANEEADPSLTSLDSVVGKVIFSIPYLGFLAAFAKTPRGFILLVIVPATIIIYEEIKGLLHEINKKIKRRADGSISNRRAQPDAGNDQAVEHVADEMLNPRSLFPRPAIILPVFISSLVLGSLTVTFFVDRETSAGNVFARSGPTPTPSTSVTPTPTVSVTPSPTPNPGEPFVDAVTSVSGTFGHCCDANDLSSDPSVAANLITGAPDSPPDLDFIQISDSSVVTAQFVDNKAVDGAGFDIRLHVYDTEFPGSALIEVSPDCTTFSSAGIHPDTANVDIDLSSAVPALTEASCVRLTDQVEVGDPFPALGFDLDTIEALHSVSVP